MKLESLADGSPDCPLVRLYDFTPGEARQLHGAVIALASGSKDRVDIHCLPGVKSIGNCRLTLVVQPWDGAILRKAEPAEFECGLTRSTWDNVAWLVEPFTEVTRGYQWLVDSPGETQLLLSIDGRW